MESSQLIKDIESLVVKYFEAGGVPFSFSQRIIENEKESCNFRLDLDRWSKVDTNSLGQVGR